MRMNPKVMIGIYSGGVLFCGFVLVYLLSTGYKFGFEFVFKTAELSKNPELVGQLSLLVAIAGMISYILFIVEEIKKFGKSKHIPSKEI